jgi:hypothetical protein
MRKVHKRRGRLVLLLLVAAIAGMVALFLTDNKKPSEFKETRSGSKK